MMVDPIVQAMLRNLTARSKSDALGELASEVLAGRMTLRDASRSTTYGELLTKTTDDGICDLGRLSEQERQQYMEHGKVLGEAVGSLAATGASDHSAEELAERAKSDPRVAQVLDWLAKAGVATEPAAQPEATSFAPPDESFDESFEDQGWLIEAVSAEDRPRNTSSETGGASSRDHLPPRSVRRSAQWH